MILPLNVMQPQVLRKNTVLPLKRLSLVTLMPLLLRLVTNMPPLPSMPSMTIPLKTTPSKRRSLRSVCPHMKNSLFMRLNQLILTLPPPLHPRLVKLLRLFVPDVEAAQEGEAEMEDVREDKED